MDRFGDRTKQWSTDSTTAPSEPVISRDAPATWKDFGMSLNAISFGFAATAVLISMFLLMAIFEHFIKPRISSSFNIRGTRGGDGTSLEIGRSHGGLHGKVHNPSKVGSPVSSNFSVVMPGQHYPTYIAQPAPLPCTREGIHWPSHDHFSLPTL
jgi:hypothetical protein